MTSILKDLEDWFWFQTLDGSQTTGRARLSGRRMTGYLIDTKKSGVLDRSEPLNFLTEAGHQVTCLDTHYGSSTETYGAHKGVNKQEFLIGNILVGSEVWNEDWFVSRSSVKFDSDLKCLKNPEIFSKIGEDDEDIARHLKIMEVFSKDFEIRILGWKLEDFQKFRRLSLKDVSVNISYPSGKTVPEVRRIHVIVAWFFSLIEGRKVGFENIVFETQNCKNRLFFSNFFLEGGSPSHLHGSSVDQINTAEDVDRFQQNLLDWIERYPTWEKAYLGFSRFLDRDSNTFQQSLLDACSWFDKMPGFESKRGEYKEQIAYALQFLRTAPDQGVKDLFPRIEIALNQVNEEVRADRLKRIVLRYISGEAKTIDDAISDAAAAYSKRGKFAHTPSDLKDSLEFEKVLDGALILDCLCLHQLFFSLPAPSKNTHAHLRHPMLDYHHQKSIAPSR